MSLVPAFNKTWAGLITLLAVMLAGCATGERPTLLDVPMVEDPAIAQVLDALSVAEDREFSAEYVITTNFGGGSVSATVVHEQTRWSVTIGNVRFLSDDSGQRTCDLTASTCRSGLDDTAVSNTQVTHQFWSRAMVNRLRTDSERNVAPARGSEAVQAGEPAVCVIVPVLGGEKTYCALVVGPLSLYGGPDVTIELVGWSNDINPDYFSIGDA